MSYNENFKLIDKLLDRIRKGKVNAARFERKDGSYVEGFVTGVEIDFSADAAVVKMLVTGHTMPPDEVS